jgi:hypothetical protein
MGLFFLSSELQSVLFFMWEFPECYSNQSADPLPVFQPPEQNAYTFRARGFQSPDKTGHREIQGKPKVSRAPRPPREAPTEKENEQTYGKPITINQQNDLTTILDEVRFAQERDFAENLQDIKQQTGGAKKNNNFNLDNIITTLKANGYTIFKTKLAQGGKRVRKSRAKSKILTLS